MAMSRKHYREVAEIIREVVETAETDSPSDFDKGMRVAADHMARSLANMFKADNSHFSREKFMDACGLETAPPTVTTTNDSGRDWIESRSNGAGGLDWRVYG